MCFRILFILLIISLTLIVLSCKSKTDDIRINKQYSNEIVLRNHAIPDTNTAVKIAEALWLANFGDYVLRQRPYEVNLERGTDTIWHIKGTAYFSNEPNVLSFGGVAMLSIRSKDCKIIELNHSE